MTQTTKIQQPAKLADAAAVTVSAMWETASRDSGAVLSRLERLERWSKRIAVCLGAPEAAMEPMSSDLGSLATRLERLEAVSTALDCDFGRWASDVEFETVDAA